MLKAIATAALGLTLATAAPGDTARMSYPTQAGSLHEGPLDMVAYWVPLDDGGYEVTATFRARETDAGPMRVVMQLDRGDDVSFSMPGHRAVQYRFAQRGVGVDATAAPVGTERALALN